MKPYNRPTPLSLFSLFTSLFLLLTATALCLRAESPKKELDRIAELQKELDPNDSIPPNDLIVSGTLRTESNKPLPPHPLWIYLDFVSHSPQFSSSGRFDVDEFGNFKQTVSRGDITLGAKVPGYAPLIVGPLTPNADNTLPVLDLVLKKGFPAAIQLNDPSGKPIANAHAVLSYQREDDKSFFCPETFTTDASGTILVPNAIDRSARLEVDLPGFQYDLLPLKLSPDTPAVLQLTPAAPATGTIVDSNNKPVAKASIALLERKGFHDGYYSPSFSKTSSFVLTTTDAAGHFSLTSLRDDSTYAVLIFAPGCATQLLESVKAGNNNLDATLPPTKPIELEIHAAAGEKFPKDLKVTSTIHRGNSSYNSVTSSLPIKVQDGIGHLTIDDPLPASYTIRDAAGHSITIDAADFTNPIILDLSTPSANAP